MIRHCLAGILLLASAPIAASGQTSRTGAPDTVVVPSGTLRLRALLWMPDGPGPFPAILFNPGAGCRIPPAVATRAAGLPPTFVKHGYAVLILFRRGDGLSADQGKCMGDLLRSEEIAKGPEARNHLQLVLLTTDHLTDVVAGLSFLRSLAKVDASQIGVVGHSFGGQLTLLAAEQDTAIRAVVTFAAAAASWDGSPELRTRLLAAVRKATVPVMLVHAADDSSTAPAYVLAGELSRFELVEDVPSLTNDGRPKRWVVVRPRGGVTGILLARADGDHQAEVVGRQFAGRVGLFLRVDDFEAAYDRMVAAGVVFVSAPRVEPYGKVAVFLDIEGNRWDLLGRVAGT